MNEYGKNLKNLSFKSHFLQDAEFQCEWASCSDSFCMSSLTLVYKLRLGEEKGGRNWGGGVGLAWNHQRPHAAAVALSDGDDNDDNDDDPKGKEINVQKCFWIPAAHKNPLGSFF